MVRGGIPVLGQHTLLAGAHLAGRGAFRLSVDTPACDLLRACSVFTGTVPVQYHDHERTYCTGSRGLSEHKIYDFKLRVNVQEKTNGSGNGKSRSPIVQAGRIAY